jgi:hypothetical protein
MESFGARHQGAGVSVSIKVRVVAGCFHREHSPHAYELIDQQLSPSPDYEYREHENGPELLTWITDGFTIAAAVTPAVIAIVKARRSGVEHGDKPREPIELIVRRVDDADGVREETILRLDNADSIDPDAIKALLDGAAARLGK